MYGDDGEARQLFEDARSIGIVFLGEGSHRFTLENGAILAVYASPYTPSLGHWGFQYHPSQGHNFDIIEGVDLVITRGPPKDIMDYTDPTRGLDVQMVLELLLKLDHDCTALGIFMRAGALKWLPGAKQLTEKPSHFTEIDKDKSTTVEKVSGFQHSKFDTSESKEGESKREQYYRQQRYCVITALEMQILSNTRRKRFSVM